MESRIIHSKHDAGHWKQASAVMDRVASAPTRDEVIASPGLAIAQSKALTTALITTMKRFFYLVHQTLREIGDENAYQRHLTAHGVEHSGAEWRKFCDERWLAASKRARCC